MTDKMSKDELKHAVYAIDYALLSKSIGEKHDDFKTLEKISTESLQEARTKLVEALGKDIGLHPPGRGT